MEEWITWSPCPQRDQSSPRMSSEDDQTLKECQKAKSRKHSCLQWPTILSPEGSDCPQKWEKWGIGQPRFSLMMRELNSCKSIRAPALNRTLWPSPSSKNKLHLLHEPPQNLERLKCKVTFPVTEIKVKYPEQTMKQLQWAKWNVGRRLKPKNQTTEWRWLWRKKLSWITGESFRHINKLKFPETHTRAQEYYSTVQPVWILGVGGNICVNFKKEAAGSPINFESISSSKTTFNLNQRLWCANHTNSWRSSFTRGL